MATAFVVIAAGTNVPTMLVGVTMSGLYSVWPPLPFVVGAAELLLVTAFVLFHPAVRQ